MTVTSDISSNALNFLSHLQNGVDPRTGLYTLSIALPALRGNDLLGPDFELALRYSPLNLQDTGYGKGWNLQLSQFDPDLESRIVSLASGETYKATGRVGATNQLAMQEKKIDSFHLYEESDSRWRLAHRSGQVEMLESQGSLRHRRALPVQVFNEQGQWIKLEYVNFNDGIPRLSKVTDMHGDTLLQITRESALVTLTFRTDTGSASYTLVLVDEDRKVGRIELPTENKASWRLKYNRLRNMDCIDQVHTPTGGFEEVFYQDEGHKFPIGSGLDPLPRVTQHLNRPGHGQPMIDTRYTYSKDQHNFLGGNASLDWKDDGLDNLFRKPMDYDYGTTETLWVEGKPVRSIERTFNKFHLVTREATCHGSLLSDDGETVVGNNILEKITTYNLRPGLFSEQPKNCQLPHAVQTRWRLKDNATQARSDRVASTYDDYGNLLTYQAANGVVETSTWYTAAQDGYPGDPEGFVRHLKRKVVTPATGHSGQAPTLTTTYRYEHLGVLADSVAGSGQQYWTALQSETFADQNELYTVHYSYYAHEQETAAPDAPMVHGRLRARASAFPCGTVDQSEAKATLDTLIEYAYTFETIDWDSLLGLVAQDRRSANAAPEWFEQARVLRTQQTTKGYDEKQKTTAQGFSLSTGEMLLDLDEDNVARFTRYDGLRRMVRQVVAPGSVHEALRSEAYHLCATEQEQAQQRSTDSMGVMTTHHFDGLGRTVEQTRDHLDPAEPEKHLTTVKNQYDAWGRELATSQYDWLDGQAFPPPAQLRTTEHRYDTLDERSMTLRADGVQEHLGLGGQPLLATEQRRTTEYRYDAWGERSMTLRADGVQEHLHFDPTQTDEHNNVFKTRWLQAPRQTLTSEKVRSTINVFEKPQLIERLDLADAPVAVQKLTYDGLGRCLGKTDERGFTTGFEYDAFSRMTANLLPDETRIERRYAAHSEADLPVSIVVISNVESQPRYEVGTQEFDGLDRLVSRSVGKRLEQFLHKPGQSAPVSMTTAAKETINYTYKLDLSPLPTSSSAVDEQAIFDYHPITSLLTSACNEQGQRKYEYDLNNRMTHEHWITPGSDTLTTSYATSFQGLLATHTDAGAVVTTHSYDERGRTQCIAQGNVVATFEYDSLGRVSRTACCDQANHSTLTTDVQYDEHGRECRRTQQLDGQPPKVFQQTWGKDGLLEARELQEGNSVLHREEFLYDAKGRLNIVDYSGLHLPEDDEGRSVTKQVFRFDALDNITTGQTTFADASSARTQYTYDKDDRCQLTGLTLIRADQTKLELIFSYDANGNLQVDEQGRALRYDSQNRLLEVGSTSRYRYDGLSRLMASTADDDEEALLWFEEDRLSLAMRGATATRYCRHADLPLAVQSDDPGATLLLHTSATHSVMAESKAGAVRTAIYLAHGQSSSASQLESDLGFNGEALDAGSGWYLLGNGYRAYNPALMRFNSPDSESPFATGGLNPYIYCLGNPVTLRDPTGHSATGSWGRQRRLDEDDPNWLGTKTGGDSMKWIWVAVAVAATIGAVFTAGASLAAVGAFGAGAATAVATAGSAAAAGANVGFFGGLVANFAGTSVLSAVLHTATAVLAVAGTGAHVVATVNDDPTAGKWAEYLGFASIGVGVASGITTMGKTVMTKFFERGARGSVAASVGQAGLPTAVAQTATVPGRQPKPMVKIGRRLGKQGFGQSDLPEDILMVGRFGRPQRYSL
ncbi:RHS repeat domain-containing protein [Pseudomonas sp. UBA6562]|uniref:RHS repeat domain-containing protein n=1 Tax=Pseudomonas sp. UBA6562 TaxID=1947332 RepID=UPI0025F228A1|nr:RHS repeat-associated core domain-containing protein [Pseudomonas sp. UBA6562]